MSSAKPRIPIYEPVMKYRPLGNAEIVPEKCKASLFTCC